MRGKWRESYCGDTAVSRFACRTAGTWQQNGWIVISVLELVHEVLSNPVLLVLSVYMQCSLRSFIANGLDGKGAACRCKSAVWSGQPGPESLDDLVRLVGVWM